MRAHAIIGAGFGDEGKGRWVDHLAHAAQGGVCWVVRFNSGAQAGHTVQTPTGQRHVFHQVGSGAFAGAFTYLGPEVAIHPMLLEEELQALAAWGVRPRLAMAPQSPVTLPYDVLINQAIEQARGTSRHGSCGVGFGETVERHQDPRMALSAHQLGQADRVRQVLDRVARAYVPRRLAALGLPPTAIDPWLTHEGVRERFVRDAQRTAECIAIEDPQVLRHADTLIFEGAQGLRLDMDLGHFPHVTRSHTGLPQVAPLGNAAGIQRLDVTYATRAYVTRHGAGPLPGESRRAQPAGFTDSTNVPNPHQGTLRFAPLDVRGLARSIQADRARCQIPGVRHGLAISCLDQMGPMTSLSGDLSLPTRKLAPILAEEVGAQWAWEGWGPTREDAQLAGENLRCYTGDHPSLLVVPHAFELDHPARSLQGCRSLEGGA